MAKHTSLTDNQAEMILAELWENAAFNIDAYNTLEKLLIKASKSNETSIHPLPENYYELSTIRNRHLITHTEQEILRKTVVSFFGLSVGSNAAITWMLQTRADTIKILDPDIISPTNLNRVRFGWQDVGKLKVDAVTETLRQLNPQVEVISSTDISFSNMEKFLLSDPKTSIIVDEIDDLESKIFLRKFAKKYKLPVVSAADVGDNVMLDIERYDLEPSLSPFLGRVKDIESIDFSKISDIDRKKLIIKLIGFEQMSETLLDSLLHIGKSVISWPQLGATAAIAGGVVTTTIKKILLGEKIVSGRYYVSLDEILVKDYLSPHRILEREKKTFIVKEKLKLT